MLRSYKQNKNRERETREIAQLVKCSLNKHEALRSDPNTRPCENQA